MSTQPAMTSKPRHAKARRTPAVSKLQNWDTKASVRVKPRRLLIRDEEAMGKLYFSPELAPASQHPLVRQFGPEAVREVQVRHLYRYLDFTTLLELEVIGTVSKDVALGKVGPDLPEVMREDAFKLCTDEAHHAYFSDDVKRQVASATGVVPFRIATPRFLRHLREVQAGLTGDLAPLSELLFAVVSETLISGILSQLPKDERVVTVVREIVADHAEDEGRHSAYFSQLFGHLWPRLPSSTKAAVGPLLPEFILAFLEPDHAALRQALGRFPLTPDEVERVIDDVHPAARVVRDARQAATVTLRLFEHSGVLDDPGIADAFRARGLAD